MIRFGPAISALGGGIDETEFSMSDPIFEFFFDGRPIRARQGQSVAEALLDNGIGTVRITRRHDPRGPFCNMGVCFECRAVIDGEPNRRTCMTPASPGLRVETQDDARIEAPDETR